MAAKSTFGALAPLMPVLLSILGLSFLVAAAFVFAVIAGLAATGVSCLLVAYQVEVGSR